MKTQILPCWADAPSQPKSSQTRPTGMEKGHKRHFQHQELDSREYYLVCRLFFSHDYSSWHHRDYISYIIVNVKPLFPDHPVSAYFQFGPQSVIHTVTCVMQWNFKLDENLTVFLGVPQPKIERRLSTYSGGNLNTTLTVEQAISV